MHSVVTSGGQLSAGGVESVTVTLKQQPEEFPASSVAVQHTWVVPIGNKLRESGTQASEKFDSHGSHAFTP